MPQNNPNGVNGYFDVGGQESAYGAQKRLEESTRAVPMPPAPGVNAPKKSQRRAVKGQQPQQAPPPSAEQQLLAAPPAPQNVWAEALATVPGAPDYVQDYANGR
jgi:hypothetical protein